MVIALIGAGRIGSSIAESVGAAGHTVHTLRSDSDPSILRSTSVDLLVLAAASENEAKYADFDAFCRSLDWMDTHVTKDVPLAAVSHLSPEQLHILAGPRPAVRFMVSSAVTESGSLRFYDHSGDPRAIDRLETALPGPWRAVSPEDFGRYTRLLIVSAVHCGLLNRIEHALDLDEDEEAFLEDTLDEAKRMIQAHDGSVADALDSAMTPGGMTRTLVEERPFSSLLRMLFDA